MSAVGREQATDGTRLMPDAHGNHVVIWCRCRREQWATPCQKCATAGVPTCCVDARDADPWPTWVWHDHHEQQS